MGGRRETQADQPSRRRHDAADQSAPAQPVPEHRSVHHPSPPPRDPRSVLARLRTDLAEDLVPAAPTVLEAADRSVQVHACHGRTRQVEVLREVVVGLLADDRTLEPRDVIRTIRIWDGITAPP